MGDWKDDPKVHALLERLIVTFDVQDVVESLTDAQLAAHLGEGLLPHVPMDSKALPLMESIINRLMRSMGGPCYMPDPPSPDTTTLVRDTLRGPFDVKRCHRKGCTAPATYELCEHDGRQTPVCLTHWDEARIAEEKRDAAHRSLRRVHGFSGEDQLHPSGRCTCAGEGECEWCRTHCAHCGATVEHHGPGRSDHSFEPHGGDDDEAV